jgi:hypothetical protein
MEKSDVKDCDPGLGNRCRTITATRVDTLHQTDGDNFTAAVRGDMKPDILLGARTGSKSLGQLLKKLVRVVRRVSGADHQLHLKGRAGMIKFFFGALFMMIEASAAGAAEPQLEINTHLMEITFQMIGPTGKPNELSGGTVFILGKPAKDGVGSSREIAVAPSILSIATDNMATPRILAKRSRCWSVS